MRGAILNLIAQATYKWEDDADLVVELVYFNSAGAKCILEKRRVKDANTGQTTVIQVCLDLIKALAKADGRKCQMALFNWCMWKEKVKLGSSR